MTVVVPILEKTGAYQLQQQIAGLSSKNDPTGQLTNQRQIDLVNTLMAQGKLQAASILSTISYKSTLPILTQLSTAQTNATAWVTKNPAQAAWLNNNVIPSLQVQAVQELMASGAMPAASILSTMSYIGAAAN